MKNPNEDPRQFQRLPKEVKIEVSELKYPLPLDASAVARTKNISPKGLCFTSATPYEPKATLTANIYLAGWQRHKKSLSYLLDDQAHAKPLTVIAQVVWCDKNEAEASYEIGIRFHDIHQDDYQALKKFLASSPSPK